MALGQVKKNSFGTSYPRKERINENLKNGDITPCVRNGHKYINESQLYDLMLEMKTDKVKPFRKWLVTDVLPTIRKTGGYVANEDLFVDTYLPNADENTKQLFRLNLSTIRQLNNKIEEMKPLADFATQVSDTSDLIDIGRMAKLLREEHIDIGRNKLFDWLRKNKILMKNNTPYQRYIDGGYFKVKESMQETAYGTKVFVTTYVTGKGQIYIAEKLREQFAKTA